MKARGGNWEKANGGGETRRKMEIDDKRTGRRRKKLDKGNKENGNNREIEGRGIN